MQSEADQFMEAKVRVAIIGGGFAGLAAATALRRELGRQVQISLFESGEQLGGLAAGFREPEWKSSLEHYYHHIFRGDKSVIEFARIWGCDDALYWKNPSTLNELACGGFACLDSAVSLLCYPDLSFLDSLRTGGALAWLKVRRDWRSFEGISAKDWCLRYMGQSSFRAIWEPLLVGKFGEENLDQVSMAWLWARLKVRTSQLGTFVGGFQTCVDAAEAWLRSRGVQIFKSVSITNVCGGSKSGARAANSWEVCGLSEARGVSERFSGRFDVILFTCSRELFVRVLGRSLCADSPSMKQDSLGAQVFILSLKRQVGDPKAYWYSFRKTVDSPFLAGIQHTALVPRANFGGEHIWYLGEYLPVSSPRYTMSADDLLAEALKKLCQIQPDLQSHDLKRYWFNRARFAQPLPQLNGSRHLPAMKSPELPGIYHVSMSHVYPWDRGTNFALEFGNRAAMRIVQDLRAGGRF